MIAFSSIDELRDTEIQVVRTDGTRLRTLTHNSVRDETPAWSPNGRWIAFARTLRGSSESEIYVMRADGTNVRRLTRHSGMDADPTWSPDGPFIAFAREVAPDRGVSGKPTLLPQ